MNPDFHDMLSALSDTGAEFLLVGAYALAAHGLPRATGDIDIWVRPDQANARKVFRALAEFGAPLEQVSEADFSRPGQVYQIGVPPRRIDLMTEIDGVSFEEAWREREEIEIADLRIPVISRHHLLQNKRATGRARDLADAAWLEERDNG